MDFDPASQVKAWAPLLDRLGLPAAASLEIAERARLHGVSFMRELRAAGVVTDDLICRTLAAELGVAALDSVDPDALIVRDQEAFVMLASAAETLPLTIARFGGRSVLLALERLDLGKMRRWLAEAPELARRMCIASPLALREALLVRFRPQLINFAVNRLWQRRPEWSARTPLNCWQGFALGVLVAGGPIAVAAAPEAAMLAVHLIATCSFLACAGLRFAALSQRVAEVPVTKLEPAAAAELPVYSVLVALYRETEMVPQLLVALGRLVWPRSKLEIKLVCEADDAATLAAIQAAGPLRPGVEVIKVPRLGPRTKPKALAYALPAASGELIVLYDAEDRPHPLQLREAWQAFQAAPPELACLQAPLVITNAGDGLFPRLFAVEYAALFRALLPWLAARRLVLPLGGTSNHFRRSALDKVGGWDPYNVTEDADLGIRLVRCGYRSATLKRPTLEDAPPTLRVWLPQRTRWLKGYLRPPKMELSI